jgi:hypothetical protein
VKHFLFHRTGMLKRRIIPSLTNARIFFVWFFDCECYTLLSASSIHYPVSFFSRNSYGPICNASMYCWTRIPWSDQNLATKVLLISGLFWCCLSLLNLLNQGFCSVCGSSQVATNYHLSSQESFWVSI